MAEEFVQKINLIEGFLPVDLQSGANTGDWVSLKNYHSCAVVFISAIGTAADDPTLTLQQATDVTNSASDAKDLDFTVIYRKQAATDLSSTGTWTRTAQSASNTYTNATSAEQDLMWIVDFTDMELDAANNFDCLRATVADVGSNAQLGYLFYALYNPRVAQATLLSAIVD
jgi:hypothetical protein